MELIRCHADNFGVLSDKTFDFSDKLNAFCLENGKGKSTLCAFIKCMLYGLSDNRSRDPLENERKHFAPWQGGPFGGSLTLRFENRVFRIHRSFGTRPSEDLLEVFDEKSGAPTDALGACPGETMLGMDADGFASCAIFSERGFAKSLENESLLTLLGREEAEQNTSLTTALARMENERKLYEKRGGRGLLAETAAEISLLTAQHAAAMQAAEPLKEKEAELLAAKAALSSLTKSAPASTDPKAASTKRKGLSRILLLPLSLAFFIFCALGFSKNVLFFIGAPIALLLAFPCIFCKKGKNHLPKRENKKFAKTSKEQRSEDLLFEECYQKCTACERAYEQALEAKESADYLALQIAELKKKNETTSARLADIKKTEELLILAGKQYRESRSASAKEGFSKLLSALGEEESEKFRLGDRFTPSILEKNSFHSAALLSRGERDRISLARNLSILSVARREKRPPLLLDDPFLCYDDERLSRALVTLSALALDYQIIYLTCSHSRMP
jgi:uncharacterized protein YhaN